MATKIKSCLVRQKQWDVCEGNCSSCWPKVYQRCKSSKKVNRTLIKLDDQAERQEENEQEQELLHRVEVQGYILIMRRI